MKSLLRKIIRKLLDNRRIRRFKREVMMIRRKPNFDESENIMHFSFEDQPVAFKVPDIADFISFSICKQESFFDIKDLLVLRNIIPSNSVIVDGGANIGNHAIFFAKVLKAKKIYCFEPQKKIFNILVCNIHLNKLNSIIEPIFIGLSDKKSFANIDYRDDIQLSPNFHQVNHGGLYLKEVLKTDGIFQLNTLDFLLFERLTQLDFIKLDIQGFEIKALKGSENLIKKFLPLIQIECMRHEELNKFIIPHLSSLGYRLKIVLNTDYIFEPII